MSPRPVPASCALLLDIDGTLIDSTYHHALAWHRAFRTQGRSVPVFRIHRSVGMGGDRLVAHVAGDKVEERFGDRLRAEWREQYLRVKDDVSPLAGAAALVRRAATAGFRIALASSGDPQFAEEAVAMLEIADEVSVLTTSEDVSGSKPAPDLVEETLARLEGLTHAVMVGDTPYDVEAAGRAGLGCVGLLSGGYSASELTNAGAVLVVDLPEDLLHVDWLEYCAPIRPSRN